jgi:exodeoxyribonuclease VII small subunit
VTKPEEKLSIEESLRELEAIVSTLENDEITLEESLQRYERGITLIRLGRRKLSEAELKIRQLTDIDEAGQAQYQEFEPSTANETTAPKKSGRSRTQVKE